MGDYPDATIVREFADCRVIAHPALPRAIRETLQNAIEHNPDDVAITVSVSETGDGMAVVTIADTGKGIPKFDIEAIEGSAETPLQHTQGLGLWIIYWTVTMSNGTLELSKRDSGGTACGSRSLCRSELRRGWRRSVEIE
ncbi:MAG: sensor histidine kinase [Halobacteriales archaeon]